MEVWSGQEQEDARGKAMLAGEKKRKKHEKELIKELEAKERRMIAAKKNQSMRDLNIYTLGGEVFNSITHGIAALAGAAVLVICIIIAATNNLGAVAIAAVTIYGVTAFAGFTISTVYHALSINGGKRVLRVLDHCSIYFIIAGTYTPFSLVGIGGWIGWAVFAINWALCVLGTTLTAVDRERFKRFAFICYLTMGWIIVVAIVPLINAIGLGLSFWLLVGGGLAYTAGAVVYKKKGKYMHGVWHLFTLAGLLLQFFSIALLMTS